MSASKLHHAVFFLHGLHGVIGPTILKKSIQCLIEAVSRLNVKTKIQYTVHVHITQLNTDDHDDIDVSKTEIFVTRISNSKYVLFHSESL